MAALTATPSPVLNYAPVRMKTLGRKCLLCSGADKLRKIITLFVLVAINARHGPPSTVRPWHNRVLLCHKDAYHSINVARDEARQRR